MGNTSQSLVNYKNFELFKNSENNDIEERKSHVGDVATAFNQHFIINDWTCEESECVCGGGG